MEKQSETTIKTKVCSKCGIEKNWGEFYKDTVKKYGIRNDCKQCVKKFREKNKDKIKESRRKCYEKNKEKYNKKHKEWLLRNIDNVKETAKKYREENKEKLKENWKEYYEKNKAKLKENNKEWRLKNRQKLIKQSKEHYYENIQYYKRKWQEYYENKQDELKEKRRKYYKDNKSLENKKAKKRSSSPVLFKTYAHQLTVDELPIADIDGYLLVICTYCGRYFYPTQLEVRKRIGVLKGIAEGEQRIYCSKNCKKACPIYNVEKWPRGHKPITSREVQPELRQMRLLLDDYICQKCHRTIDEAELHCHHITGVQQNPIESADLDNCITLCKKCHKWAHSQEGCRYFELTCK